MGDLAPFQTRVQQDQEALALTANGSKVVKVPFAGSVSSVSYTPIAAVTGANSPASRTLSVTNKGQAGAGATSVASLALVSGTNLVAYDEKAVTLSGTAANLVVAAGDILSLDSTAVGGTGLADPGGTWEVIIDRTL
jgi:hypothetical protein